MKEYFGGDLWVVEQRQLHPWEVSLPHKGSTIEFSTSKESLPAVKLLNILPTPRGWVAEAGE